MSQAYADIGLMQSFAEDGRLATVMLMAYNQYGFYRYHNSDYAENCISVAGDLLIESWGESSIKFMREADCEEMISLLRVNDSKPEGAKFVELCFLSCNSISSKAVLDFSLKGESLNCEVKLRGKTSSLSYRKGVLVIHSESDSSVEIEGLDAEKSSRHLSKVFCTHSSIG